MKTVRIATVLSSGRRYLVQQIDFRTDTVHVWGEVLGYKNLASNHGASLKFARSEVALTEAHKDLTLVKALFEETLASRRAAGHVLARRGATKVADMGKQTALLVG